MVSIDQSGTISPIFGNDQVFGKFQTSGKIDFDQRQIFWKSQFLCGPEMEYKGKIFLGEGNNFAEGRWNMELRSKELKRKMRDMTGIRLNRGQDCVGGGFRLVNDWRDLFAWRDGLLMESQFEEAGDELGQSGKYEKEFLPGKSGLNEPKQKYFVGEIPQGEILKIDRAIANGNKSTMRDLDSVLASKRPVEGKVLNDPRPEGKKLIGNKGRTVKDD